LNTSINIIDGRGEGNRSIPVYQANINTFNYYARTDGLGRFYRLMENVTLPLVSYGQSNWISIGSSDTGFNTFNGIFDGQGHTISNLTIYMPDANNQGMFGQVTAGGLVKNVGLIGGSIIGNFSVGGIMGTGSSNSLNMNRIINCFNTGDVSGNLNVGGLAGTVIRGSIKNSYTTGNVNGNNAVGGIVGGQSLNSYVINSFSTGNISGRSVVGGVVGSHGDGNTIITNSVALNILITKTNIAIPSEFGRVIGNWSGGTILINNHANSVMIADGNFSFPNNQFHASGINGADVSLSTTRTQSWWENTAMFNFGNTDENPWKWDSTNQRPKLYWE
jgi:hypothetical protein